MNRYLAQEKRVFDISKFTVVGSPTITEYGVASGLSNNDYIVPTSLTLEQLKGKSWSYSFKCTIPDTSASSKYIISFGNSLFPSLAGGIKFEGYGIYLGGKYGTTEDSTNELWKLIGTYSRPADVGKEVLITASFNIETGEYNAKAILDNKELNMTPYIPPTANKELYYINTNSSSKAFRVLVGNDKFYLKSIKITVDGQTVFTGTKPVHLLERRKEGFDLSKFTVVGSPTITEDGVASGFSRNDYINCGNILNPASVNELEIKARVKLESTSKTERFIGIIADSGATSGISINRYVGDSSILKFLVQNNPNNRVQIDVPIQLGIYNDLCLKWNNTNKTLFAYLNKILIGTAILKEGITADYSNAILQLGALKTNYSEFLNGSIDLPSISITADGKEVFTGAKESYYVLRS